MKKVISFFLLLLFLTPGISRAQSRCEDVLSQDWQRQFYGRRLSSVELDHRRHLKERMVRHLIVQELILLPSLEEFIQWMTTFESTVDAVSRRNLSNSYLEKVLEANMGRVGLQPGAEQTLQDLRREAPGMGADLFFEMMTEAGQTWNKVEKAIQKREKKSIANLKAQQDRGLRAQKVIVIGSLAGIMTEMVFGLNATFYDPSMWTHMQPAAWAGMTGFGSLFYSQSAARSWSQRHEKGVERTKRNVNRALFDYLSNLAKTMSPKNGESGLKSDEDWENWRREALILEQDPQRAEPGPLASRQLNLSLMIENLGAWQLPNGESFRSALADKDLASPRRLDEIKRGVAHRRNQLELLNEEIDWIEEDMAALEDSFAKSKDETLFVAQQALNENAKVALSRFRDILSAADEQMRASEIASQSGEKFFREFCQLMLKEIGKSRP